MAMIGNDLGDKIAAIITASDADEESKAKIKALWRKIGSEIVQYIQSNAEVMVDPGITVVAGGYPGSTTSPGQGTIL